MFFLTYIKYKYTTSIKSIVKPYKKQFITYQTINYCFFLVQNYSSTWQHVDHASLFVFFAVD